MQYPWMKHITFHSFPHKTKKKRMRQQWINMVRREQWEPNRYLRLCSIHFVGLKGPTVKHPVPTMFDYNDYGGLLKINKCKAPANRHSGNQPDGPPTDMECDHLPEEMITANDLAPHQENEVTYSTGT